MGKSAKKLNKAIRQSDHNLAWSLINDNLDSINLNCIHKDGSTYLINAVLFSSSKIVSLLIKQGADVNFLNRAGDSTLSATIENYYIPERLTKTKLLLNSHTNPESIKYCLHLAANAYGSSEIVKLLINYGLNINLQDNDGDTPLIKASLNSDGEESVIHLLKAGANLEITNNLGLNFSLGLIGYNHQSALDILKIKK